MGKWTNPFEGLTRNVDIDRWPSLTRQHFRIGQLIRPVAYVYGGHELFPRYIYTAGSTGCRWQPGNRLYSPCLSYNQNIQSGLRFLLCVRLWFDHIGGIVYLCIIY